jgi:hypothetical protein
MSDVRQGRTGDAHLSVSAGKNDSIESIWENMGCDGLLVTSKSR